jgi:hypothetical protein
MFVSIIHEVVVLCCEHMSLDSEFCDIEGVLILFQRLIIERDSLKETNEELKCSQFAGGSCMSGTTLLAETTPSENMIPPEFRYVNVIFQFIIENSFNIASYSAKLLSEKDWCDYNTTTKCCE